MWFRTRNDFISDDGDSLSLKTDSWDALRFKAKKDCYFLGAGMLKNAASKDFVLELKYRVFSKGEEDSEPIFIEVDSKKSPENDEKMHWFDIQ